MRVLRTIGWICLTVLIGGGLTLRLLFDRTREFKAKAREGEPIVTAIESFIHDAGRPPDSLRELVPQYLPSLPPLQDYSNRVFFAWDYSVVSNRSGVSYTLGHFMGKGGVRFEPPYWVGNDEGRRIPLFKHKRNRRQQ